MCRHEDWQARATVTRVSDDDGAILEWVVDLEMSCVACLTPMLWAPSYAIAPPVVSLPCRPFDVDAAS
jgi:hypothetical protein